MALTLKEIQARLKAQEETAQGGKKSYSSNEPQAFLAHWNIPDGIPLNLRFLPDGDESNDYFWKERDMINLSFNGIVGGDSRPVKVTVPCNEMWGVTNSCPVLKEVREWYKAGDKALEDRAREYWKKKSYLMQCFVGPNSAEVDDDKCPANPIRRVMLNKGLFAKVKSILLNPQIEYMPTDVEHGRDFGIIKGKQGQYANYDQSQWSFGERPLNQAERDAIETHGLFNLSDFMPKQPTADDLVAIAEMFEASVNGEAYDPARWAAHYRPAGVDKPQTTQAPVQQTAQAQAQVIPEATTTEVPWTAPAEPVQQAAPAPKQSTAAPAQKSSTADLLAKLKASKS